MHLWGKSTVAALVTAATFATAVAAGQPSLAAQQRLLLIGEGKDACPPGYLCAWESKGFTGRGVAIYGTEAYWGDFPEPYRFIDNTASSFFNNGTSEHKADVRLGRLNNLDLGTFVLCNGDAVNWIGEGRGDGALPGQGWNDQVSSNEWFDSYWCK